jgi:hypothetical protein
VFSDSLPGLDPALADIVAEQARLAGYGVEFIQTTTLTNEQLLRADRFALLALPAARVLPANARAALEQYLRSGGDLLALGLPAWQSPTFLLQGRWWTRADYEQVVREQRAARVLVDFEHETLSGWTRHSNESAARTRHEVVSSDGQRVWHATIDPLTSWDTLGSPPLTNAFQEGHTLTCFRAKGGPNTRQLAIEWTEADGSRWIAPVDLTTNWQHHALLPEAFKPWEPRGGRGGPGDQLNVRNVAQIVVGLALSHTALEGPRHEFWFDDLGTAPNPFGNEAPPASVVFPRWESLSPEYQVYPVTSPVVVKASHEKVPLEDWERGFEPLNLEFATVARLDALHPRPRGVGYDQRRPWRWEPLLGAYDPANNDYRGALAALLVHVGTPFRGGVWAVLTPADIRFYQQPLVTNCLRQVLRRMRQGLFLVEGGSEFFTVFRADPRLANATEFPDYEFRLGARAANFGPNASAAMEVELWLDAALAPGRSVRSRHALGVERGAEGLAEVKHRASDVGQEATVEVLLWLKGGETGARSPQPIDWLRHRLYEWRHDPDPEFIRAHDGGFTLADRAWKAHGVNYMPSSGIGITGDYFEHWLGRGAYDPAVIQRDIERIKAMGMNAVSVFIYHRSLTAHHLLDFLRLCQMHALRVNLSLRPGTPMDFRWTEMREIIRHYRLAESDTVFAYDLAWEPSHYDEAYQQKHYAAAWNRWVLKRHLSLDAAETAWEFPAPRVAPGSNTLRTPPAQQLTQDGPWRKLMADYRLFLDEWLGTNYAEARRLVRTVDLHHPVSFRMQFSGDPTHLWPGLLPYDFYGLRNAVDLWEPEAYGRIGDWEKVKPGHFTAAYARLCDPAKPVLWAEVGFSVWDPARLAPQPEKLDFQARYFADFYRMLIESGADGVFSWWYPGGFRVGENSDYGIINPDGTDRPVTKVIREHGARFLAAPQPPPPDHWIAVDREADARGLPGIYEAVKDEYWQAISQGKRPSLKWKQRPGGAPAPPSGLKVETRDPQP